MARPLLAVVIVIAAIANQSAFAHSRGMGTLDIRGQGSRLLLTWVFYYDELPSQLVLPDGSGQNLSPGNPQDLKQSLGKVAEAGFRLKLGKQILGPPKVSQIIVLPDKTCLTILTYPVEGAGSLEVQAPILRLLPANYLINVRFMGLDGKIGSTLIDRNSPPLVAFVGGEGMGDPGPSSGGSKQFRAAFTTELGTAWVHTNWILLGLLLILSYPIREAGLLLLAVIVVRIGLVHLAFTLGLDVPWRIPTLLLCLPIVLMAALAIQSRQRRSLLTVAALGAGLIYTAYDLQFLPWRERASSFERLMGYQFGFLAGFFLALAIVFVLGSELNKSLRVQGDWWRRTICWAAAGISLWISIYSIVAN
jgi:hypothetical protein